MEMDKEFSKKELEKQAELKDKILRRKEKLENYVKETTKNFGFKDKQGSMSDKEFNL
jgi:exoribonuclease II